MNTEGKGEGPAGGPPYAALLGLGFELVAPILLLMGIGYYLDGRLGTRPWLLIVGAVLGGITGLVSFIRRALPPGGAGPAGKGPGA